MRPRPSNLCGPLSALISPRTRRSKGSASDVRCWIDESRCVATDRRRNRPYDGGLVRAHRVATEQVPRLGRTVVRPLCTLLTLTSGVTVRPIAMQVVARPGIGGRYMPARGTSSRQLCCRAAAHPPFGPHPQRRGDLVGRATALGPLPEPLPPLSRPTVCRSPGADPDDGRRRAAPVLYPDTHRFHRTWRDRARRCCRGRSTRGREQEHRGCW